MENNYTVYCHTLKSDGRKYFGATKDNVKHRWNNGKGHSYSGNMKKAIDMYGWEAFEHTIIRDGLSKEEAYELEIELIKKFKTQNEKYGFNRSSGGEKSGKGVKPTAEAIAKTSSKTRGKKRSKEFCEKVSKRMKNKVVSEETREKLRQANLGKTLSEETKKKISEINKGKNYGRIWIPSEEYRENARKRMLGHKLSQETIEKIKCKTSKPIICVETNVVYPSAREAERQTGVNFKLISMCCNGKCKTVYKQHWKFVAE